MRWCAFGVLALVAIATARCDSAGEGRVLEISATGIVKGLVYLDRNGNRQVDGADTVLRGVRVRLIGVGTLDTAASVQSDSAGGFRVPNVPIGSFVVALDTTTIGDTVRLIQLSAAQVVVRPGDSLTVTATISFPAVTVRAARQLPAGRKVFVQGILLSPRPAFGDTTGHLADTSAAIRLTRMRAAPVAGIGDSVRLLGLTTTRDGQATLDDVVTIPLGPSGGALPTVVSAAGARSANGGALDAALVFVGDVTIVDTATVPGTGVTPPPTSDRRLTVDSTPADTAGRVEVLLDAHAGFTGLVLAPFLPDSVLNVTGVLVPAGGGRWRLKPRIVSDAVVR